MLLDWYKHLCFHIGIWPLNVIYLFSFETIYELAHMDIFHVTYLCNSYLLYMNMDLETVIWNDIPLNGMVHKR